MRVLVFHPWGRFDPAHCGASRTAVAHLDYFQRRGWEVHCVLQEIPAWGVSASGAAELRRFACVKSVRSVKLDCPPVAALAPGDEFCRLLYAAERAARGSPFRALAAEPWGAFLTTDVTAAPFAHALPRTVRKVLGVGDSYTRRADTGATAPPALREAEERFAFARIEAELYRLFDQVVCTSEADAQRAWRCGTTAARHVAPIVEPPRGAELPGERDLLIRGGTRWGELADLERFYRQVYLPYLRAAGVHLTVAGPVAERFPVCDLQVTKLPEVDRAAARIVVAPACAAAGPHVAVADALAAGSVVVTTPEGTRGLDVPADAAVVIDMRADPAGTAAVIRDLLAAPGWCGLLGARAARITERHTRARFFTALDSVWTPTARVPRVPHFGEAA